MSRDSQKIFGCFYDTTIRAEWENGFPNQYTENSGLLLPVRGCVELWRRGQHSGTLRKLRAAWGLCDFLGGKTAPSPSSPWERVRQF